MALKGDRNERDYDVSFFMNETAEMGGVVVASTVGSGAALDQSQALVTYSAAQSGKLPVGLLLNDMVNYDLTRQHLNFYKHEVQKGSKVTLLTRGWVLTNMIVPGHNPAVNQKAYLGPSGLLQTSQVNEGQHPTVGMWLSAKDQDGYAKVSINLPQ